MPNRLIAEKSPYLQQHAHNSVDWYPWGEEAFRKAREEGKPIFLSIGYSTCHWCHVMERESFENPEIAELLHRWFVSIKVDREERPDVDRVYMAFVQATTGGGGWPLSVWLTPELKPFFGGTYFPPSDVYGRPGFAGMLQRIAELWRSQRQQVLASSEHILAQMRAAVEGSSPQVLDSSVFYRAFKVFEQSYDRRDGGFGGAPKFPRPVALNFLLRYYARTGDRAAAEMVLNTLGAMARGGLYDHLGGGFHRYSVDASWHVPHFEKMLYDQAQLALSCLEGCQVGRNESLARVARETLDYVLRDLTDPATGGFYSAEDADSPEEAGERGSGAGGAREGAFYVWSFDEIRQLLGGDADLFCYHYGVLPEGNADNPQGELAGKNVLYVTHTVPETAAQFAMPPDKLEALLEQARSRLRQARARRPRPHRDEKIITAWNGLMISALARAVQVLDEPRYRRAGERAAEFLVTRLWRDEHATLARRYCAGEAALEAGLEDYAFLAQGLLDLYEAGFDLQWLKMAERLTERAIELFWDEQAGGFFTTSGRDPSVLLRMKEDYDGAEPSGNSIAALTLARLADMLDRAAWRQLAERTVQAFGQRLSQHPETSPQLLVAFEHLSGGTQIVIAGERDQPETQALLGAIRRRFLPGTVLLLADQAARRQLGSRMPFLNSMTPRDGRATAYVCRHFACDRPVQDAESLDALLGRPISLVA